MQLNSTATVYMYIYMSAVNSVRFSWACSACYESNTWLNIHIHVATVTIFKPTSYLAYWLVLYTAESEVTPLRTEHCAMHKLLTWAYSNYSVHNYACALYLYLYSHSTIILTNLHTSSLTHWHTHQTQNKYYQQHNNSYTHCPWAYSVTDTNRVSTAAATAGTSFPW